MSIVETDEPIDPVLRTAWDQEITYYDESQILPARRARRCDFLLNYFERRWLGSRVVSVLDSGGEGHGFKFAAATLSGNSLRQTVHTHCASVHQAAKLVAALLRVVRVTAGLAESNGSLPPGLWLTSPAGWLPRTEISSGTLRSAINYGLPLPFLLWTPVSARSYVKANTSATFTRTGRWSSC